MDEKQGNKYANNKELCLNACVNNNNVLMFMFHAEYDANVIFVPNVLDLNVCVLVQFIFNMTFLIQHGRLTCFFLNASMRHSTWFMERGNLMWGPL